MKSSQNTRKKLSARLEAHNKSRVYVQEELERIIAELVRGIDETEQRLSAELEREFNTEDAKLQALILGLVTSRTARDTCGKLEGITVNEQSYGIVVSDAHEMDKKLSLSVHNRKYTCEADEPENIIEELKSLCEKQYESKLKAAEKLAALCKGFREEVNELRCKLTKASKLHLFQKTAD